MSLACHARRAPKTLAGLFRPRFDNLFLRQDTSASGGYGQAELLAQRLPQRLEGIHQLGQIGR